jgi:hypothetical protein
LIQDWDLDENARPDTLRLLFATPRRWLADGSKISVEGAPTQFGRTSLAMESHLNDGYVEMKFTSPPLPAKKILLRAPVPDGWRVIGVEMNGQRADLIGGNVVELTGHTKPLTVKFTVER